MDAELKYILWINNKRSTMKCLRCNTTTTTVARAWAQRDDQNTTGIEWRALMRNTKTSKIVSLGRIITIAGRIRSRSGKTQTTICFTRMERTNGSKATKKVSGNKSRFPRATMTVLTRRIHWLKKWDRATNQNRLTWILLKKLSNLNKNSNA